LRLIGTAVIPATAVLTRNRYDPTLAALAHRGSGSRPSRPWWSFD